MNRLSLIGGVLILILVFGQCKNDPYMDKTNVFSGYLEETFKSEIANEQHYYFITPKLVCSKCIENILKRVEQSSIKDKETVTFVTSNPEIYPEALKKNYRFLIDEDGELDYLNLELQNLTIFETQNGKIKNVALFNPNQYQEFIEYLKALE